MTGKESTSNKSYRSNNKKRWVNTPCFLDELDDLSHHFGWPNPMTGSVWKNDRQLKKQKKTARGKELNYAMWVSHPGSLEVKAKTCNCWNKKAGPLKSRNFKIFIAQCLRTSSNLYGVGMACWEPQIDNNKNQPKQWMGVTFCKTDHKQKVVW